MKFGSIKLACALAGFALTGTPAFAAIDLTGDTFNVTQLPYSGGSLINFGNTTVPSSLPLGHITASFGADFITLTSNEPSAFLFNTSSYFDFKDLTGSLSSITGFTITTTGGPNGQNGTGSVTIDTSTNIIEWSMDALIFQPTGSTTLSFTGGTSPTPEPATWAMMIAGFGLAGAAMRRRQQKLVTRFA